MVEQKCREIDFQDAFLRKEKDMANAKAKNDKKFRKEVGLLLFGAILGAIFTVVIPCLLHYSSLSTKLDDLSHNVDKQFDGINSSIDDMSDDISSIKERLAALEAVTFNYRPTSATKAAITGTYNRLDAPITSGHVQLCSACAIAYSNNIPNREYTVKQLAGQPILLPYTENGKEIFFYGQLDGNGNWDGHCVVNVYKDDKLELITDAQYDSGKLLSCKQAFPDSSTGGQDVWVISKRVIEDDHSSGETWRFFRSGDFAKDFTIDTVEVDDIMDADQFRAKIDGTLEGYYHGENSKGKYNDDSGDAYLCKYFEDGTIRTLYIGKFKDGQFEDSTGNAWMVGKLKIGDKYSYYRGPFTNGNRCDDPKYWEEPLTIDRVKEIVNESGLKFKCGLKWENDSL